MSERRRVCVVGACNTDLIAYCPYFPKVGETLKGTDFKSGFGGKGANQAVQAARLLRGLLPLSSPPPPPPPSSSSSSSSSSPVFFIGKLGEDTFGTATVAHFKDEGLSTEFVYTTPDAPSGVAPILVDQNGHNCIVVVGGANDLLTTQELDAAEKQIAQCSWLVCQLELSLEVSLHAFRLAKKNGVKTLLNPAPVPKKTAESGEQQRLLAELCSLSDILCPNEPELEMLTDLPTSTLDEVTVAARSLLQRGPQTIIVTLGKRGSLLVTESEAQIFPAPEVKAIDTTGAGDSFIGSFIAFLLAGNDIKKSIELANVVASESVKKHGTQTSYPTYSEISSLLK